MKSKKSKTQDEFMAAATGDLEWLKQSLRDKSSKIDFDENVIFFYRAFITVNKGIISFAFGLDPRSI